MGIPRDSAITLVNEPDQPELDLRRKGRRIAKAKPPDPKEFQLQIAVYSHFQWRKLPGWQGFHTANGEYRDTKTGAKLKAMGVMPGVPDLVFIAPSGRAHFLELKRKGQRIFAGSDQDAFRSHCELWGWPWAWADTIDAATRTLEEWGAIGADLNTRGPA